MLHLRGIESTVSSRRLVLFARWLPVLLAVSIFTTTGHCDISRKHSDGRLQAPICTPLKKCCLDPAFADPQPLHAGLLLRLRGGAPRSFDRGDQLDGNQIVMDMRTPEEKALAEATMKEDLRAREEEEAKTRPPDSWRTKQQKIAARKELEKLAPDLNLTAEEVDEAMDEWRSLLGSDVPEKQLVEAALADDVDDLEDILDEHPEAINRTWADRSALMTAAYQGHLTSVCLLLERGIDLEVRDSSNWTALHFAVSSGRPLVVEVLLRAGAQVNVHDSYRDDVRKLEDMGVTPLHLARRWMERAGAPWHPLYDPRGGDSYWRIEQMLFAYGATEWKPRDGDSMGQSIRPAWEDSDVDKELMRTPLSDAEKEWLVPSWFHPDEVKCRQMYEDGIDPRNESYFEELDRQAKDADRSSSETSTETEVVEPTLPEEEEEEVLLSDLLAGWDPDRKRPSDGPQTDEASDLRPSITKRKFSLRDS